MKIDALLYLEEKIDDSDLSFNGTYIPDHISKKLEKIESIGNIYYSLPDSYTGKLKDSGIIRTGNNDIAAWKEIFEKTGSDHIVKIYCDSPFMDPEIIREMLELQLKYMAEFTFSENLPLGISAEIISKELINSIPEIEEKTKPIIDVIKSNINQFDVEIYYKEPDIRDKRLAFRTGNKRELKIMEGLLKQSNEVPHYPEIKDIIEKNPETLYAGPSYLEIELTGQCDLKCIFCYRETLGETHGEMDVDSYKKILSDMKAFGLPYSICLGGSGEPMMHSKFYEIAEMTSGEDLVQKLVIETNGLYADTNFKNFLISNRDRNISVIFNINALDEETYSALHGTDDFQKVFKNILSIAEEFEEKDNLYLQIMKINETEPFVDRYYDFWEKYKIPIIFQKQNTFLGKIDDRRYSDLTPLERTPCWHLQRDLYILSDGSAGFCKQDIDGAHKKGNINNDGIEKIWENAKESFLRDYRSNLNTSPDCKVCDEWYTFNL